MYNPDALARRDAKTRRREANLKRLYEACRLGRVDDVTALFKEDTEMDINTRSPLEDDSLIVAVLNA